MKKTALIFFVLLIVGCQNRYNMVMDKHNLKGAEKTLEKDNQKLKDIDKESAIALKKREKIVKGSPFEMQRNIIITDVQRTNNIGEITAHSARIDRVNTGAFEFYGIFNISDERATLKITDSTKFLFQGLKQEDARRVFYETIFKPSSYYLIIVDNDANIEEIRKFIGHIYYSAEELHKDIYPNRYYNKKR